MDKYLEHLVQLHNLTPAQHRVLEMLCTGETYRAIGWKLDMTERNVQHHATAIYNRMTVKDRKHFTSRIQSDYQEFLARTQPEVDNLVQQLQSARSEIHMLKTAIRNYFAEDSDVLTAEARLLELVENA